MPAPTSYDEDELAAYMLAVLDDVGKALRISAAASTAGDHGDLTEPVNNVLLELGTDDLTTVSTPRAIQQLRALAAVHAWRFAADRAASRYDSSDGTTKMTRSQLLSNIAKSLATAERIASALGAGVQGSGVKVRIGRIRYPQDPYRTTDESAAGAGLATDVSP